MIKKTAFFQGLLGVEWLWPAAAKGLIRGGELSVTHFIANVLFFHLFSLALAQADPIYSCTDTKAPGFFMEYSRPDKFNLSLRQLIIEGLVYVENETPPCQFYATPSLPFYFLCDIGESLSAVVTPGFVAIYKNNQLDKFKSVFKCVKTPSQSSHL